MTEVTDADRQAAARIYQLFRDYDYAKWIMDGTNASGNGDSVIQAFARHREAAEAPLRAEIARLTAERDAAREELAQWVEVPKLTLGKVQTPPQE